MEKIICSFFLWSGWWLTSLARCGVPCSSMAWLHCAPSLEWQACASGRGLPLEWYVCGVRAVQSDIHLRGVLWCNEPTNSFNACRVHYLQDQLHISNTSNRNLWKYSVYHDFGMITRIVFSNKVFDTNYVDFLHYGGVASCVIDKVCCTACLSTFVGTVVVSLDCRLAIQHVCQRVW